MAPAAEAADQDRIGDTDLTERFSLPLGKETEEMEKRNACLRMSSGTLSDMLILSGPCGIYLFVHVVILDMEMVPCNFFVVIHIIDTR
jgi:hypothetical protein